MRQRAHSWILQTPCYCRHHWNIAIADTIETELLQTHSTLNLNLPPLKQSYCRRQKEDEWEKIQYFNLVHFATILNLLTEHRTQTHRCDLSLHPFRVSLPTFPLCTVTILRTSNLHARPRWPWCCPLPPTLYWWVNRPISARITKLPTMLATPSPSTWDIISLSHDLCDATVWRKDGEGVAAVWRKDEERDS